MRLSLEGRIRYGHLFAEYKKRSGNRSLRPLLPPPGKMRPLVSLRYPLPTGTGVKRGATVWKKTSDVPPRVLV